MATCLFLSWAYWETKDAEVCYGRHSISKTRCGPWGPPCEKFGWGEYALTGNSRISIFHPSRLRHSPLRGPYRLNFCQAIGQHQNQSRMPSRPGPVKIAVCEGNARARVSWFPVRAHSNESCHPKKPSVALGVRWNTDVLNRDCVAKTGHRNKNR